jgi:sugar lactone lactonase YvrE
MNGRSPISPVVWHPPAASPSARGRGRPTLPPLRLLPVNGLGPEKVVVAADGYLLAGLDGGRILRLRPDGREIFEVADTGGRPLGMAILPGGALAVCDAYRGLLRVDPRTGEVELLTDRVNGEPMQFCKSAAAAGDGTVYFTDASRRFGLHEWKAELLEHSGTGRLLCRRPDGSAEVLLDGLQFATGVALTPDGQAVVVAETGNFQLIKYWLDGPRAGTSEVFARRLPGYVWDVALGSDSRLWVAMASPRHWVLDMLAERSPWYRKALWAMPERVHPKPIPSIGVLALNPDSGVIERNLHGPAYCDFQAVTGVAEHDGTVYLSGVAARSLAALDVP